MSVWAVIPVKSFAHAKSRLTHLSESSRRALARSLFVHVIECARACTSIAGILVLTNGDDVHQAAHTHGADVLRDTADADADTDATRPGHLGRVVDTGLTNLEARGVTSALVLMSDLPHLSTDDIDHLVEHAHAHALVIAPDHHEQGTNALALPLHRGLRTCFGRPDSLARHRALATSSGLDAYMYRTRSVALDIDWPADMAEAPG